MITILSLWAYKVIFWPGAVYTELSSILGGQNYLVQPMTGL